MQPEERKWRRLRAFFWRSLDYFLPKASRYYWVGSFWGCSLSLASPPIKDGEAANGPAAG